MSGQLLAKDDRWFESSRLSFRFATGDLVVLCKFLPDVFQRHFDHHPKVIALAQFAAEFFF
jgi:hypothetical protein